MQFRQWSHKALVGNIFFVTAGALICSCGCGKTNVANAQTPPPQSLSEPARLVESEAEVAPAPTPTIPASNDTPDFANQKAGESRALPVFVPPTPPPTPAVAVAPLPNSASKDKSQKCHILAKGETIYALSKMYNVKPKDIIAANQFKDPSHLAVGTKVYIPQ